MSSTSDREREDSCRFEARTELPQADYRLRTFSTTVAIGICRRPRVRQEPQAKSQH